MADENDFTDHLLVVRPPRVEREMTPPAMAERTTDEEKEHARLDKLEEEQRKNILEQIGRSPIFSSKTRFGTLGMLWR